MRSQQQDRRQRRAFERVVRRDIADLPLWLEVQEDPYGDLGEWGFEDLDTESDPDPRTTNPEPIVQTTLAPAMVHWVLYAGGYAILRTTGAASGRYSMRGTQVAAIRWFEDEDEARLYWSMGFTP